MKHVLVVDDSADYRRLIVRWLQVNGFRVYEAPSALHALQILHSRLIDVLLADERMPKGGSGMLLLEAAADTWPGLNLALVSASPSADAIIRAREIGARVFTKGEHHELVEFVQDAPRRRHS